MFTGDGTAGSSGFLARALHANGLVNIPTSESADDGQVLTDVWITAVLRCAPPDNKPLPIEIQRCHSHLAADIASLPNVRVYVAFGKIAFDACWRLVGDAGLPVPAPKGRAFGHGATFTVPGGPTIISSYHPSRQNTQTGRLTPAAFSDIFARAKAAAK
jgi:uracil-DNA glycosylase family 4